MENFPGESGPLVRKYVVVMRNKTKKRNPAVVSEQKEIPPSSLKALVLFVQNSIYPSLFAYPIAKKRFLLYFFIPSYVALKPCFRDLFPAAVHDR